MAQFDLSSDGILIKGECFSIDDIDFRVSISVKLRSWRRTKQFHGKVSMSLLRSPNVNTETDEHGVILPKRWTEGTWKTDNEFGIFGIYGNCLHGFVGKLAEIISTGEVECYVGMPTSNYRMPIDNQRCEELKSTHGFLMELHGLESLYDTVVESYKRHMKHISSLSIDSTLEFSSPRSPSDTAHIFRTATIDCTAFLSLFGHIGKLCLATV